MASNQLQPIATKTDLLSPAIIMAISPHRYWCGTPLECRYIHSCCQTWAHQRQPYETLMDRADVPRSVRGDIHRNLDIMNISILCSTTVQLGFSLGIFFFIFVVFCFTMSRATFPCFSTFPAFYSWHVRASPFLTLPLPLLRRAVPGHTFNTRLDL